MRIPTSLHALLLPLLASACGGTANVAVQASSTATLAQSADTAASSSSTQGGGNTTADALLLHVVRTEAHVSADGSDAKDDNTTQTPAGNTSTSNDNSTADNTADNTADSGFVTISTAKRDVDLKALATTADQIADGTLPSGKLTQIRLILDANDPADLVVGGVSTKVSVPSGAETGMKLLFAPPLDLQNGDATSLSVQVDGTVAQGNGSLSLSPTLKLLSAKTTHAAGGSTGASSHGNAGAHQP